MVETVKIFVEFCLSISAGDVLFLVRVMKLLFPLLNEYCVLWTMQRIVAE